MGAVLQFASRLITEECCTCGMTFAMPESFRDRYLNGERHGQNFYCPQGHPQRYTGQTEAQRLREQLEAKEREIEAERRRTGMVKTELRGARVAEGKAKAETSRIKQRVGGGTCPCCKRNFSQLRRHMEHKHPTFRPSPEKPKGMIP